MLRTALVFVPLLIITGVSLHGTPAAAQSLPAPSPASSATAAPASPPASPATSPPAPPSASTPWPAPTNLRVNTVARLLDEAGRPLPPAQQEHADVLTWDHRPGQDGQYNIEVTLVPRSGGPATVLQPFIVFPADRGNGTISRISQFPEWLNNQRCHRGH